MTVERERPETWALSAFALLAVELALVLYIGSRTGGASPVKAYLFGPTVLMGVALALGVVGILTGLRRPPFARRARVPALLALAFVFLSSGFPYPFPAAREGRPSRVAFELPVEGEWTAAWGGDDTGVNLLARSTPARRYALCLVRTAEGRTLREGADPADPASYLSHGARVFAPAEGRVVRVVDGIPDRSPGGLGDELGNHVVLEVAAGECFVVSNLLAGSIACREGDELAAGAELARVGASARSRFLSEPHLGLQLQDSPDRLYAQGVPWFLHDVELDGTRHERAMPAGGGAREGRFEGQRVSAGSK